MSWRKYHPSACKAKATRQGIPTRSFVSSQLGNFGLYLRCFHIVFYALHVMFAFSPQDFLHPIRNH
jgi:hypothetical protein